jgi:hypothetical protein
VWEVLLVAMSLVMIAFPLYASTLSILYPPIAPAQSRITRTPTPEPPTGVTDTPAAPTDTPQVGETPTNTSVTGETPTNTSVTGETPTNTSVTGETPTNTSVTGETPTNTPITGASPTNTIPVGPSQTPTISPTPFVPPEGPPLTLLKFASVSSASPGQQFSYSLAVRTTSTTPIQVSVSDSINGQLEVLSASSGCSVSGQSVNCTVTVSDGNPAGITIQVRARSNAQGNVGNQASASSNGTTAASDTVVVAISGEGVTPQPPESPTNTTTPPTATNTSDPSVPTTTNTSATSVPPPPATNTSVPPPPPDDGGDGDGDGGGDGGRDATEVPPAPPAPPEQATQVPPPAPPTPRPPAPPAPTRRPVTASPARTAAVITASPAIVSPQPSPTLGGPPPSDTNVFFRIASDWGSAYPGQDVRYTLVLRNTRPANPNVNADLTGITIRTTLPGNLEVLGASSDRGGTPAVNGNDVQLALDRLRPGEGVEISIRTRIKLDVARGTLIVAQGQVTYSGLNPNQSLFSNVVTVLVVDAAPTSVAQTTPTPTLSPTPSPTPTPEVAPPTATSTLMPSATSTSAAPSVAPDQSRVQTATPVVAGGGSGGGAPPPLPATSTGVPLLGFALLGMTLLVRTVRLHRARERI